MPTETEGRSAWPPHPARPKGTASRTAPSHHSAARARIHTSAVRPAPRPSLRGRRVVPESATPGHAVGSCYTTGSCRVPRAVGVTKGCTQRQVAPSASGLGVLEVLVAVVLPGVTEQVHEGELPVEPDRQHGQHREHQRQDDDGSFEHGVLLGLGPHRHSDSAQPPPSTSTPTAPTRRTTSVWCRSAGLSRCGRARLSRYWVPRTAARASPKPRPKTAPTSGDPEATAPRAPSHTRGVETSVSTPTPSTAP